MGDISIALCLENFFELVGNAEWNDFDFLTTRTDDVVMVVMEFAVFFIAVEAFTQVNHVKDACLAESFQRAKKSGPIKINLAQTSSDFFSGQWCRLIIRKLQYGQAQWSTFESSAAKQRF